MLHRPFTIISAPSFANASAIALPLYAGYKIVDYVCDKIDINSASATCLDIAGAVGTLALTIDYTLPALSVAGLVIGSAIGAVTGRTIGHGVKGIEKIIG